MTWIPLNLQQSSSWFTAVVTPENSAPVHAAHQVLENSRFGDLVTGYPWQPLRTQVAVPTANEDAGLPVQK